MKPCSFLPFEMRMSAFLLLDLTPKAWRLNVSSKTLWFIHFPSAEPVLTTALRELRKLDLLAGCRSNSFAKFTERIDDVEKKNKKVKRTVEVFTAVSRFDRFVCPSLWREFAILQMANVNSSN